MGLALVAFIIWVIFFDKPRQSGYFLSPEELKQRQYNAQQYLIRKQLIADKDKQRVDSIPPPKVSDWPFKSSKKEVDHVS